MIPSYEQVGDWLEEISAGFPDAFFDQLDGGIQLEEEDEETWKDELFATVAHEFTHHMEETAGLHALDDQDAEFLRRAREEYGGPL